jgi:large subunit ribosomal protein L25
MERIQLEAQNRSIQGKKVKQLRAQNWIPSVVYGPDTPPKLLQIQERALHTTLQQAGSTALIDLRVEGEANAYVVLPREIQRDVLTGRLQHLDFYQVRLTEKVRTMPLLNFVGESPLVHGGEAVLIYGMNEVEVECLPTDLVSSIDVDISGLETLSDKVLVRELPVPPGVTILADPDDVVVSLVTTRAAVVEEEEMEELAEGEFGEEVEEVEEED